MHITHDDINTPDNKATLDVNKLIKALDKDENAQLLELTKSKIKAHKNDILQQLQLSREELKTFHYKLRDYRYVSDLSNLNYGAYIRWIRLTDPENIRLTNGGLVLDMKIYPGGLVICCKNNRGRIFQFKFDECLIFQKLSDQERLLLEIVEYLNK